MILSFPSLIDKDLKTLSRFSRVFFPGDRILTSGLICITSGRDL